MKAAEITPEVHQALSDLEMGNLVPEIVAFEKKENSSLDTFFSEAFEYRSHTFYTEKIQ